MESATQAPVDRKADHGTRESRCERCARSEEENAALRAKVAELAKAKAKLEAKLKLREDQLFGRKTEQEPKPASKSVPESDTTGSGAESTDGTKRKRKRGGQKGAKGHGRRNHDHLPSITVEHDFLDEEKCCGHCKTPYKEFPGTEDSVQIEIEIRVIRTVHERKRYQPQCDCAGSPRIITAPGPAKLIPKGLLGTSLWVQVLLDKFLFQRPTYRLLADLKTHGLDLSQATLTSGMRRLAPLFDPILAGIHAKNIEENHWHADETRWLVFVDVEGKEGHRWWLWVFRSKSAVEYVLSPWRAASVPEEHYGPDANGVISADRYAVYKKLAKSGRFKIAFCWAHTRRDFVNLGKSYPHQVPWAQYWIDTIGELYRINGLRRAALQAKDARAESAAKKKLSSLLKEMVKIRDDELADGDIPEERAKVLTRLLDHWDGLILFLDDAWIPMDNNEAERLLRNPVVGRKNYYGSGAVWSGQFAATLFSVFQTLQIWGLNPRLWLRSYFDACAASGGKPPSNIEDFLPWTMSEETRRSLAAINSDSDVA